MSESFNTEGDQSTDKGTGDDQGTNTMQSDQDQGQKQQSNGTGLSTEAIDSLIKRDTNAQDHIKTLEKEAVELREALLKQKESLDKAATYKEVLDGIDKDQQNTDKATTLSSEELVEMATKKVRSELDAASLNEKRETNWSEVTQALTKQFGDKTDEHVKSRCTELGMVWSDAVDMAKGKPNVFKELFGVKKQDKGNQSTDSSVNTSGFQGNKDEGDAKPFSSLRSTKERADAYLKALNAHLSKQ